MARENATGTLVFSWILRIAAAGILVMAGLAKLTSNPDSVKVFVTLGAEPLGRFGLGIAEVLVAVLILISRTRLIGAAASAVLMVGAIGSHATKLGWAIELADGSRDPSMAVLAFVLLGASVGLIALHRDELPDIGSRPAPAAD